MQLNTAELNGNTPSSLLQTGLHSMGLWGTVLLQGNWSPKELLKALLGQLKLSFDPAHTQGQMHSWEVWDKECVPYLQEWKSKVVSAEQKSTDSGQTF